MRSSPTENILRESRQGTVLAHSVWIKKGPDDPTLEAELYRLVSLFKSIEEEAKLLEAEIKKRADS